MKTLSALTIALVAFSGAAQARVAHPAHVHHAVAHHARFVAAAPVPYVALPPVANDDWKSHWGF